MPLEEQDRSRWDRALIAEGQTLVRRCLRINRPGPYQLQAAINAVHSDARTAAATDWRQILRLYDQLLAVSPTPIVALNRAIAVAEVDGAEAGASPSSTALPSTRTTSTTPSARTCCGGSVGPGRRRPHTSGRRISPTTPPSGPSSSAAGRSSLSLAVRPRPERLHEGDGLGELQVGLSVG